MLLTAGAGGAHGVPEAVEGRAVPGVLDGEGVQLDAIALLLVKAAWDHHQVRADVTAEPPALAGVQRLGRMF